MSGASEVQHVADCRRSLRSPRGPRGGRVDRAQRSGASLNTATRGKPLRLEPRTCEDAWATGAPAPQRPSRGHRRGEGSPALATGGARPALEPGFKDPTPKRSAAERGVGSEPATGAETGSATDVTWLIYTHIFHYPHNTSAPRVSSPPDSVRGRRPGGASVCGRARGRAGNTFRGPLQAQNGEVVHGIGLFQVGHSSQDCLGIRVRHAADSGERSQSFSTLTCRVLRHARVKDDHVTCHTLFDISISYPSDRA
jgi:hypothetical protein